MKILGVLVYENLNLTDSKFELSSINWFGRSSTRELLTFFCTEIVRTISDDKKMTSVKHEETNYNLNIIKNSKDCVGMITDHEYPIRVSFSILQNLLNNKINTTDVITKFQDPLEFDQISRIQKNLLDTKSILMESIEQTLQRSENLDKLVEKSETLSTATKDFYDKSKKLNSCCSIV